MRSDHISNGDLAEAERAALCAEIEHREALLDEVEPNRRRRRGSSATSAE